MSDLLVGDVVKISTGDIFEVDGILIEGTDVLVNNSYMVGDLDIDECKKSVPVTYHHK